MIILPELKTDDVQALKQLQRDWSTLLLEHPAPKILATEKLTYASLILGTIEECLSGIYPYCEKLLTADYSERWRWKALAVDYYRRHPNPSPLLLPAVAQFPTYLATQADLLKQYPFLAELAHYEWLEAELQNAPDGEYPEGGMPVSELTPAVLSDARPVWNLVSCLVGFQYDIPALITEIKVSTLAQLKGLSITPKLTPILIYRDPVTLNPRFFSLTPLTGALLEVAFTAPENQPPKTFEAIINVLIEKTPALQTLDRDMVFSQAVAFFKTCQAEGILLGSI